MWQAEQAFRSMKSALDLEPVYHRRDRRITAHAHLCVLAYLLLRLAENRSGQGGKLLREALERVSLSRVETDQAVFYRTKRLTGPERAVWNSCRLQPPPKLLQLQ